MSETASEHPAPWLVRWGRDMGGDWRIIPASAMLGAIFFLVLWWTQARVIGESNLPNYSVFAGLLAFGALWAAFGFLVVAGLSRIAFLALLGHLVGYIVLAAQLIIARADLMDASFAIFALFGFTGLGLVAGIPLEWIARREFARR